MSSPRSLSRPARRALSLRDLHHRFRLALIARAQRRALAHLDDATLRDIGVTRGQAMIEARRPLWDVPSAWLR